MNKILDKIEYFTTALILLLFLLSGNVIAEKHFSKTVLLSEGQISVVSSGTLPNNPKIGLVLSGGGSRGMVHIGVLEALEENNIKPDMIIGTSIGSLIGGLYASGYTTKELDSLMSGLNWNELYNDEARRNTLFLGQKSERDRYLITIRFNKGRPFIPTGYSQGQNIISVLSDLILQAPYQVRESFNDLRIPFRSVSTDLVSGKRIIMDKGNLAESINASVAFPLLFSPVALDSMLLVDGGLLSNLPVDVARSLGMDIVIAVDATSGLRGRDKLSSPWEIVDQATTIMTELSKRFEQEASDVLIKPPMEGLLSDDFSRTKELILLGKTETENKISKIKQIVNKRNSENNYHIKTSGLPYTFMEDSSLLSEAEIDSISILTIDKTLQKIIERGYSKRVEFFVDSLGKGHLKSQPFGIVNKIEYSGNTLISSEEFKNFRKLQEGQPFNSQLLKQDLLAMVEKYRERGFPIMHIHDIIWREELGQLLIVINEGRIADIRIEGNSKTKNFIILREFSKQRGKVFNWKKIQTRLQNVYATQLFKRVTSNITEEDGNTILTIKVVEKSSQILRIGGKYDTDRRAQAYLEFGEESILGLGIKTIFLTRFGVRDGHLGIRIRDDRIFFTNFTYDFHGYYNWQINPYESRGNFYREERSGFRFRVGRQVRRIGQLVAEFRNEYIVDKSYKGDFDNQQDITLRTFAVRALADKRDRIDFPTSGIYNHWAWETGNRFVLEEEEKYTKALINLEGYYTYYNEHTLHLRMFVGVGDNTIPFSEQFRLGGMHEFYGLYENELYGRQLFSFNLEYRYKLPIHFSKNNFILKNTYISGRYDFAGIWKDPALVFSSEDFFSGIGVNLGISTFFGPLNIAYGKNTRKEGLLYFSIGFNY